MRTAIFISFLVAIIAFMATPIVASAIERRTPSGGQPDLAVRMPKKHKSKGGSDAEGKFYFSSGASSFSLPNRVGQLATVGAVGAAAIAFLV
ncbi:hypothetical protein L873DRAFT_1681179 [Choiromyces venosus 120613-1]|uniref:Uncharacterized protein n=1 Tax=Choiromyces venosus 120613-1 TaxID=1336337 RepID=A0A3N4JPS2_9PEZI|nr:hypothetical protein L873DRAFT_1681179 [Choiromyces venosus 120613-1]